MTNSATSFIWYELMTPDPAASKTSSLVGPGKQ
jgi:hypothetical protein